ncbi:hypothetical protein EAD89_17085 [Micromonospora sp. BL4]|uniref:hypothetical protein n=1 Tax=Micromonospora sp. BL4 TaxID=2478710 RepID=UPI000EF57EB5|nr:hypothetical protein [Micromonospora sp. BL4]RLP88293.1 hypothetical protein EAD89_17085 [Micromonospora sp. BL4]
MKAKKFDFRTLVIDDDEAVLRRLSDALRGQTVQVGQRRVQPIVDTLKVVVEERDGGYHFSEQTLRDVVEIARNRYEFIVVDYTYASKLMQPKQWREGAAAKVNLDSNDHLLTLVDLRDALEKYADGRYASKIQGFFEQASQLLLRSFQHDRKKDVLGPYQHRLDNTKGVFPNSTYYQIDSFQMIYNSDGDLRRQFYTAPPNGREFYRNLVMQFTLLHYNSAMYRFLAERAGKLMIAKNSFRLWLLVTFVAAGGAFISALADPIADAVKQRDIVNAGVLTMVGIIATLAVTFIVTLVAERYTRSYVATAD